MNCWCGRQLPFTNHIEDNTQKMWLETPKNLFGTTFATRIIFYVVGTFWTPKMATSIWNIRGISSILTVWIIRMEDLWNPGKIHGHPGTWGKPAGNMTIWSNQWKPWFVLTFLASLRREWGCSARYFNALKVSISHRIHVWYIYMLTFGVYSW